MNDIKWKDGAVCFAFCNQFHVGEYYHELFSKANHGCRLEHVLKAKDFQLNEIRQGDYITESELNTEQKYNEAVEVFGLFGFASLKNHKGYDKYITSSLTLGDGFYCYSTNGARKITYQQLMTIGKLKRAMIDFEKFNHSDIPQNEKRNKSKQAYEILKLLDYDYDLDKQKWFKKHYV